MPKTKSAKKALRQNIKRRQRNRQKKDAIKAAIKDFNKALVEGDKERAKAMLPKIQKLLDKAAKTKTIKKNKASRLKSRLAKKLKLKQKTP